MFTLLNPWFLIGAFSAGIPLALHLLHHRKATPVEWPSLKFLKTSQKRTAHRKRIEDLLLLILRMALLIVLSAALAEPFIKGAGALSAKAPTSAVIVLDNSYSMSCEHNGVPRFAAAKKSALRIISALEQGKDLVAVLYTDGTTSPELAALNPDLQAAADAVRSARASDLGGGIGPRVARALKLVESKATPNREVYIITDLQRSGWTVDASQLARAGTAKPKPVVSIIDCSQNEFTNCTVESLSLRATSPLVGDPVTIEAKLRNHSARPLSRRAVLHVGGEARAEKTVTVAPGAVTSVAFRHVFESAGVHPGYVEIGPDAIAADNRRHFAHRVESRLDILLVEGRASAIAEGRPAYYLRPAFLATQSGRIEATSPLRPKVIPFAKLSGETLSDYDAVWLLGPPQMDGLTGRRLRSYVAAGGGLVVTPGEGFDAEGIARHLGGPGGDRSDSMLPATAGGIEGSSSGPATCRLSEIDGDHPVTSLLGSMDRSALASVQISKRWILDVEHGSAGMWLMRADDGRAVLAAGRYGRGRVFLLAVPPDASWSNLAKRGNIFVPLVGSMLYYTTRGDVNAHEISCGATLPLDFPTRVPPVMLAISDPDGRATEVQLPAPEGEAPYPPVERAGLYEVGIRSAPLETVYYAVNVETGESDLTPLAADEAGDLFEDASSEFLMAGGVAELEDLIARIREGVKLWDALLAMVLVVAVMECFFSNRAVPGRRTGAEMAQGKEASGLDRDGARVGG